VTVRRLSADPGNPDGPALEEAARIIRGGGLVAVPTETFYALAADGLDREAVARALSAKGREERKPTGLLLSGAEMLERVAENIPAAARILMERFWPGPLSLILPGRPDLPPGVLGEGRGVSARAPGSAVALEIVRLAGRPVTATSANQAGGNPPRTADDVERSLGNLLDAVLDAGETPGGSPSTLVDVRGGKPILIREGEIPWEAVITCLR
jgi:L-threonylcarbamoyladenylate synthase